MSERPTLPTEDDLPDDQSIVEVPAGTAPDNRSSSRGTAGILIAAVLGSITAFGLFFAFKSYLLPVQPAPGPKSETNSQQSIPVTEVDDEPVPGYPDPHLKEDASRNSTSSDPGTDGNPAKPPDGPSTTVASNNADPDEPLPGTSSRPNSTIGNESENTNNPSATAIPKVQAPVPKHPKPGEEAIAQANGDIDAAFSAQIRNVKTREERMSLAQTLKRTAQAEREGSATRFVLLERAHKLAVDAPDPVLTNELVSLMTTEYDVDPFDYRKLAVEAWDRMRMPDMDPAAERQTHRVLAREAAVLGDLAYQRNDFRTAAVMYALASKRRDRAEDKEIADLFGKKRTAARTKETRYTLATSLLKALEEAPDDADKSLEAGLACVQVGRWDEGLYCLSKCSDESLKNFAEEQLNLRSMTEDMLGAGDQSWDAMRQLGRRHAMWLKELAVADYESALDGLTPLQLQKVKLRMQQVGPVSCVLPVETQRFAFEPDDFVDIDKLHILRNRMGHFGNGQLYGKQNLAAGIRGAALFMDGYESMVVCPETQYLIPGDWNFTISIWINSTHTQDADIAGRMYQKSSSIEPDFRLRLLSNGNFEAMLAPENGTIISVESQDPVPQGQWVHLAMTWDLDSLKLYLDGRETASRVVTTPRDQRILANRAWMSIGGEKPSRSRDSRFQGQVDEMRVYDQALSPLQMFHVYLQDQTPED